MALGKHFINGIDDPVDRALRNILLNDQSLRLIAEEKVLFRQPPPNSQKVLLLSGGGSGHEPAHAGFVGDGMLDIAVAGNIFASPSASQVYAALSAVDASQGALMIVKNYTGDKLNFGLAAEKAKADGRRVNMVVVEDDVSIEGNDLVGRRGLAGVVFVHKIAGAAAKNGLGLDEVTRVAQRAASALRTVGVSLDRCSVPTRSDQEGLLFDEVEYGMDTGIHNEPGAKRSKTAELKDTVAEVLQLLLRKRESSNKKVALLVNNLGGLSVLELNVVAEEVLTQLDKLQFDIGRVFIGTFVTSLNGPGFSVTILELDAEFESLLDAPTSVQAWPRASFPYSSKLLSKQLVASKSTDASQQNGGPARLPVPGVVLSSIITSVARSIKEDEPLITKYDTLAGDGDCGETLLNGINGLVRDQELSQSTEVDLAFIFRRIASLVEQNMGGTSGAIYAIFFNAVSGSLKDQSSGSSSGEAGLAKSIAVALRYGLTELCKYTGARQGHRTLMDALIPFVETFEIGTDLKAAVEAAAKGAEKTRRMEASFGRASYVAKEQFEREDGIPDPGALGIVSVVKGIQAGL